MYTVDDIIFGHLPEDEQLLVIPFVMRTLGMTGLGTCDVEPLHPEDEEVTEVRLQYADFREGDRVDSCLTYNTRYLSLYEPPGILIQNPFWSPKSIVELGRENAFGLIYIYIYQPEFVCRGKSH